MRCTGTARAGSSLTSSVPRIQVPAKPPSGSKHCRGEGGSRRKEKTHGNVKAPNGLLPTWHQLSLHAGHTHNRDRRPTGQSLYPHPSTQLPKSTYIFNFPSLHPGRVLSYATVTHPENVCPSLGKGFQLGRCISQTLLLFFFVFFMFCLSQRDHPIGIPDVWCPLRLLGPTPSEP